MTTSTASRALLRAYRRSQNPALRARRRSSLVGWVFVTPSLLGLIIFMGLPMAAGLIISFCAWDMLTPARWAGLDNYTTMIRDPLVWKSLVNTLYFAAIAIPGTLVVSLGLALATNRVGRIFKAYRLFFFIPVLCSTVAVSLMWKWLYNDEFGILNWVLGRFGLGPVGWLTNPTIAMISLAISAIWKSMGYYMVIFLAGLQAIPKPLYESARLDGAGAWRQFWSITLPLLSPTTFFVLIMSVIGSFQVFDQVYVMTEGGPGNSTLVLNYYLWQNAFEYFKVGYASALAYGLFLLIFVVTLLQVKFLNKRVVYDMA